LFERYVGVDLDTMVAEASRRNPRLNGSFVAASVQEFDFPRDSFDLVLSMACLASACRADELPEMAGRIVDATRRNGRIVMIEPFHTMPVLTRTCRLPVRAAIKAFEARGAVLDESTGMHFIPVRLVFARQVFAAHPRLTRMAYEGGEAVLHVAPRILSDYKLIVLRKE
jgi:hypothetical protein